MMKHCTVLAGFALGLCFAAATPAIAGPCAQQINELTNALSANDAGAGQTSGASAATAGASTGSMAQAKTELERAQQLDQQGSSDCTAAVEAARKLMQGG